MPSCRHRHGLTLPLLVFASSLQAGAGSPGSGSPGVLCGTVLSRLPADLSDLCNNRRELVYRAVLMQKHLEKNDPSLSQPQREVTPKHLIPSLAVLPGPPQGEARLGWRGAGPTQGWAQGLPHARMRATPVSPFSIFPVVLKFLCDIINQTVYTVGWLLHAIYLSVTALHLHFY